MLIKIYDRVAEKMSANLSPVIEGQELDLFQAPKNLRVNIKPRCKNIGVNSHRFQLPSLVCLSLVIQSPAASHNEAICID